MALTKHWSVPISLGGMPHASPVEILASTLLPTDPLHKTITTQGNPQ
jgi:hypothetical protein